MARSRLQRLLPFLMGAMLVVAACTTPTLPLPPPASPSIVEGTEPGTYHLSSLNGAEPNSLIIVVNRNEAVSRDKRVSGTIADGQGSWELDVPATVGDLLDIAQESGTVRSPTITVTVR